MKSESLPSSPQKMSYLVSSQTQTDFISEPLSTSDVWDISTSKSNIGTVSKESHDTTFVVPVECSTESEPKRFVELISVVKNPRINCT